MRGFAWFLVVAAFIVAGFGVMIQRENLRAYNSLCAQGKTWACLTHPDPNAALVGLMIGGGVLAFGILLLAIRPPRRKRD